jgi:large subunit ribosomal protein L9
MKVVLRENVEKVGRRGEIVRVADGYGRNYLIPKKLAYHATPGNLKVIGDEKRAKDVQDAKIRKDFESQAQRIEQMSFTIAKKVGEDSHLFGSVTTQEIADLLAGKGVEIDRRRIVLEEPIKSIGTHTVGIRLHQDVVAQLTIEVVPEEPRGEP